MTQTSSCQTGACCSAFCCACVLPPGHTHAREGACTRCGWLIPQISSSIAAHRTPEGHAADVPITALLIKDS